jgi:DNA helicase HerA-like ATPase
MNLFPLTYAHGNILFGRDEQRAALYRVEMDSYRFMPDRDKISRLARLARFAFSIQADFSLWRVNRAYPWNRYLAQAEELLDAEHGDREAWLRYLRGHEEHLRLLSPHVPELYLSVSLGELPSAGLSGAFLRSSDRARRRVEAMFGVDGPEPISHAELQRLIVAEERVFGRVRNALRAERARTDELQWLIRRAACRGVTEPMLDPRWQPKALLFYGEGEEEARYEPLETDLLRHANAPMLEEERTLVVDAEEGRSYQAMLALGALPEGDFPDAQLELLFAPLEALEFPVDACLHARTIPNRAAMAQVKRRIVDADHVYSDQLQSDHGASFEADENRILARELEAYLKSEGHPPLLNATISLAVGAPTREELELRVESLVAHFGTVALHRPLGLQPRLYFDHLPRPGRSVEDYAEYITIEQFGALMPTGTHRVGSPRGLYIGTTSAGGRRPVKFDVTEASREGRPPAILMAGTLGSGKTVAAELIAVGAELRGSSVISVDPKPDHALDRVAELAGQVEVIELSGEERYRGMLDPLRVATPSLREDLASSYLMELLPQAPPQWETHIRRAVRDAVQHDERSLLTVLEALEVSDHADAREAGQALEVWADAGLGRLAFGVPAQRGLASAHSVTTIRASGLALPSPSAARADYSQAERVSVATLKLVAAFAMRLASDPTRHSVVLFDEAWMLLSSADGRRLLDRLARLGRSQNATLVLASQQLGDIGELEGLIGTKFIFGLETVAEARRALGLLGLDPDDAALVERVRSYRRGRCLVRDLDDRIAEVQIDLVYPDLLAALDTTPRRRGAAWVTA